MADEMSMALDEVLRQAHLSEDVDFVPERMWTVAHALIEVEVAHHLPPRRRPRCTHGRADGGVT